MTRPSASRAAAAIRSAGLAACLAAGHACAIELRLCTFDRPFSPYTMPDGSGQTQELLRRAAQEGGIAIDNTFAPRARCLVQLQNSEVDGLVAAYLPERRAWGVYPPGGAEPDESYALAVTRFMVYRRTGSAVQWDGKRFSGLGQDPVGVQAGFIHGALLRQLGVAMDDGAKTPEQNIGKLAFKRLDAAIAEENEAVPLIRQYKGQLEMLPVPFHLTPLYLVVSRPYYQRHKAAVDAYWQAIRTTRATPAYQQYLKQGQPGR